MSPITTLQCTCCFNPLAIPRLNMYSLAVALARNSTTKDVLRHTLHILNNATNCTCVRQLPGQQAFPPAAYGFDRLDLLLLAVQPRNFLCQCSMSTNTGLENEGNLAAAADLWPAAPRALNFPSQPYRQSRDSFRRCVARRHGWWCSGHLWTDMNSTGV